MTAGVDLHNYECVCGFHHLSKKPRTAYQALTPDVIGAPHALALSDAEFKAFVVFDLHGKLTVAESEILRHPTVVLRWIDTLAVVRAEAQDDLRRVVTAGDVSATVTSGQRDAKRSYVEHVARRQAEAKELVAELPPVLQAVARGEHKRLRRTAGDRAIEALINRHRREFSELFYREADAVGLELPDTLADVLHRIEQEELRVMDVDGAGTDHRPRYPDVHVVLTGDEDFHDIVTLSVGAVFRHLRDGTTDRHATHAVLDIVGALHKIPTHDATAAIYILGDWVTIHLPFQRELADG